MNKTDKIVGDGPYAYVEYDICIPTFTIDRFEVADDGTEILYGTWSKRIVRGKYPRWKYGDSHGYPRCLY